MEKETGLEREGAGEHNIIHDDDDNNTVATLCTEFLLSIANDYNL